MTTDEQIEYVARTLCRAHDVDPDDPAVPRNYALYETPWAKILPQGSMVMPAWTFYRNQAVDAIRAVEDSRDK